MRKFKYIFAAFFLLGIVSCEEEGRLDQPDDSDYIPQQVVVKETKSIPGGAIVKYKLPADSNIYGVKVVYDRGGETCEKMASRYTDSLKIEGLPDTRARKVLLYSVGKNGKLSLPNDITITPEEPVISALDFTMSEVFGGVKINMKGNTIMSDLAIVLLRDTLIVDEGKLPSEIEWEELFTFHASSDNVNLTRRNLPSDPCLFGVYARDRWGNMSDTVYTKLTPLEEVKLPSTGRWNILTLPNDETTWLEYPGTQYGFSHLYDGKYSANNECFGFSVGPEERWLTVDMGYVARFSRMQLMGRQSLVARGFDWDPDNMPYQWQIWGSMDPNPDGSWDDSWYLLGSFTQYKPSGIAPDGSGMGTYTADDRDWMWYTNEYDFEASDMIPDPQRECRYFRFKVLNTCTTAFKIYDVPPTNIRYIIGEVILHGTIVEE